jgi:hypothetical protein
MSASKDWEKLQRKVFSRWVNQKLVLTRGIKIDDIVEAAADPNKLVALVEVLSEKTCPYKIAAVPKGRIQAVEGANYALKFIFEDCGVELKLKPNGESIIDKDEKSTLAVLWAIMLKFLKFGDEHDGLDAKSSLLLWVNNQVTGHGIKPLTNFGKEWHDGLALCAIIHKHRPKLLNYDGLNKSDNRACIKAAFDAAEKYFDLEQYLTVDEYLKLDEKSMLIYASEYYLGIAEQRKIDLAARRIAKLVKLTIENDALRAEFNSRSADLLQIMKRVEVILEDRTIDNTMAGAQRRLEQFYEYKTNDKNKIIEHQLSLESLFNNLAMRLAHNKRPEFKPAPGCSLKEVAAAVAHLEECEMERKVALHKELNRQIKLVQLNEQHQARFDSLQAWIEAKATYLNTKQTVESVSAAELQLRLLDAYDRELDTVKARNIAALLQLSATLAAEKYEFIDAVQGRDSAISAGVDRLDAAEKARRPVADDDLAREKYKAAARALADQHAQSYATVSAWIANKLAYLAAAEQVNNVADARRHLGNLDLYDEEQRRSASTTVVDLKTLGQKVLAQSWSTQYSTWAWDNPSFINDPEADVDAKFGELTSASAAKRAILDAALALELEKERLRLEWANLASEYVAWAGDIVDNNLAHTHFGFTLEEVESFAATLANLHSETNSASQQRQKSATDVDAQLKAHNVSDNVYSTLTVASLSEAHGKIQTGLANLQSKYDTELARQRANDALCKEFADQVEPLNKFIADSKESITNSKADLDSQLDTVDGAIAALPSHQPKLDAIHATYARIEAAGITYNRHTILTNKDVDVLWKQYTIFLEKKKKMLEDEIANQRLRGVTAEQMAEIKHNFKQFDKDGSGSINSKELKACLYSLGEEKTNSEIDKIMKEHGSNGELSEANFIEFGIRLYGDSDTQEEILAGFKLINRGEEVAHAEKLEPVLKDDDFKYITTTAPVISPNVYNYQAWTADVYSR